MMPMVANPAKPPVNTDSNPGSVVVLSGHASPCGWPEWLPNSSVLSPSGGRWLSAWGSRWGQRCSRPSFTAG